jgi:putative tricarboxylic transport membrane protein
MSLLGFSIAEHHFGGSDVSRPYRPAVGLLVALLAVLLLAGCGVTRGEESSGLHRLRMMVPNSPGGGYDLTARTAVKVMEDDEITGRIEVFNVIGAGGTVAMARLMNERGNGDLMMMMGLGVVGATYTNGSAARASDATALAKMVEEQEGILVPGDSPFRTVADLVSAWKADTAGVTIGGGSSPGGPDHLFPMELARAAGIDPTKVNYVSYDGGGDLLTALLGNKIAAGTSGLGEFTDQIEAGQLRVLAVSGAERVEGVDAPTLTESGIDLTFTNWRGILAPPDISEEDKRAMVQALEKMHATQAWKDALVKNGWSDAFMTGQPFEDFLAEQDKRVETTLTELGLV